MTDLTRPDRERQLNLALEALHFAFRAVVTRPDELLAKRGLSRVHHRILYFVGHRPGLSVSGLLGILGVTKQSLNAPLRQLVEQGLVRVDQDSRDRRVKRLSLSRTGKALEGKLSGDQRERFHRVFEELGELDEAAWRRVMERLAR